MSSEQPPPDAPPPAEKKRRRPLEIDRRRLVGAVPVGRPPTGPTRNKGGAPSKLTREVGEAILAHVRKTAPIEDAAGDQGVTATTVFNWIAWGERDAIAGKDSDYAWFFNEFVRARAKGRLERYEKAVDIAEKKEDARLLLAFCERSAPELYVPPHRRSGGPGGSDDVPAAPAPVAGMAAPPAPRVFLPAELEDEDEDEDEAAEAGPAEGSDDR